MIILLSFLLPVLLYAAYAYGHTRGYEEASQWWREKYIRSNIANADEYLDQKNWSSGKVEEEK